MSTVSDNNIPLLTDIVSESMPEQDEYALKDESRIQEVETLIAELQTLIASRAFALTDEIMRTAFAEMEASIFQQISSRLRQELPELIDSIIREQLEKPVNE